MLGFGVVSSPRKTTALGAWIGNPAAYCDIEAMALAEYKRAPMFHPRVPFCTLLPQLSRQREIRADVPPDGTGRGNER